MREKNGDGLRFVLAYRELVKYIHLYMPNITKETMQNVIDEIFDT